MELSEPREMLRAHRPADAREAAFLQRMLVLTEFSDAWRREHFEPGHFTASGFVLDAERSEVLLIHHKKLGIWVQPGGHVEPGDASLLEAAAREVREELGLSELTTLNGGAILDVDIHEIPARKADPAHEHFDVRFAFGVNARAFTASDEVADARWIALDALETLTRDASVLRAAERLRRLRG